MSHSRPFRLDLTESFPHLSIAPIVEAVIHWRARATVDLSSLDQQVRLRQELPDYPTVEAQADLELKVEVSQEDGLKQVRHDRWRGLRLTSADGLQIVQFNRDGMVFSRLKPYDSWERFSAEAVRVWGQFVELAKPSEIERLGVRFINRIGPIELAEVGEYLLKPSAQLKFLGLPIREFLQQTSHDVPEHSLRLSIIQAIQPPAPETISGYGLILDIDVFTTQVLALENEAVREYLMQMHWLKNKAFFSLIKPSALKRFTSP